MIELQHGSGLDNEVAVIKLLTPLAPALTVFLFVARSSPVASWLD